MDPSKELLEALKNGDVVKVKELLERGADANVKDSSGATPLHYVAFFMSMRLVRILLSY